MAMPRTAAVPVEIDLLGQTLKRHAQQQQIAAAETSSPSWKRISTVPPLLRA